MRFIDLVRVVAKRPPVNEKLLITQVREVLMRLVQEVSEELPAWGDLDEVTKNALVNRLPIDWAKVGEPSVLALLRAGCEEKYRKQLREQTWSSLEDTVDGHDSQKRKARKRALQK